jgi:hypothetical protein
MPKQGPADLFRRYLATERAEAAEVERQRRAAEAERQERATAAERKRREKEAERARARMEMEARARKEMNRNARCQAKARLEILKRLWAIKGHSQFLRIDGIDRPLAAEFAVAVSYFDRQSGGPKEIWSVTLRFEEPRAGQDLGIRVVGGRRFESIDELQNYFDLELLREMAKNVATCEIVRKQDGVRIAAAPVRTRSGRVLGGPDNRYGSAGYRLWLGREFSRFSMDDESAPQDSRKSGSVSEGSDQFEYLLATDEHLEDSVGRAVRDSGYDSSGLEINDGELTLFISSGDGYWDVQDRIGCRLEREAVEGEWCLLPVGAAGWG